MKNKLITYIFIAAITIAGLTSVLLPDGSISMSERRKLYGVDELRVSEDFSGDFEKYSLDQFVMRDFFRRLKAFSEYKLFGKKDNNGLYEYNDSIIKMLYPLDEKSVTALAEKINRITELYADSSVYYSLIPDKNYFTDSNDYLKLDYDSMQSILLDNISSDISYINLFDSLELSDYYRTDHHFKMDSLGSVLTALGKGMEVNFNLDLNDYHEKNYYPFYGAYYGQAAMNIEADTLVYFTGKVLDSCNVRVWEGFDSYSDFDNFYDLEKLGSIDSYDIFLYGTKPVVEIINPLAADDRELIIFKDSFTNSLSPLMIESYSKITLVDLRLVNHTILDKFVDFEGADILFLYSTMVANNSYILK